MPRVCKVPQAKALEIITVKSTQDFVCNYSNCFMSSSLSLLFFCLSAYKWMHGELKGNVALQYLAWVTYPMILVMFASLFCHLVSPQAIGKLSITCQPVLSSLSTCFFLPLFHLLLSVFLLQESGIITTLYLFTAPIILKSLSPCFLALFFYAPILAIAVRHYVYRLSICLNLGNTISQECLNSQTSTWTQG